MGFKKYQHIERFGTNQVQGIENGMCYVFPKIDGTNVSLWWNNGLQAGERKRQLSLDSDNAGFYKWALKQKNIMDFFGTYPDARLYGEWLVPHTLETYQDDAWKKFYVFDVCEGNDYHSYNEYCNILTAYNIDYIQPICKIENPTYEKLVAQLEKNTFLIKDGAGVGEGIVIKNYAFSNRNGQTRWAKIVKNEFKTQHQKVFGVAELKEKKMIEEEIVNHFVTDVLINKEYAKIVNDVGWESKFIPRLFNTVFYCLIQEESWEIVKKFKRPTINFKTLYWLVTNKIKEVKPELF